MIFLLKYAADCCWLLKWATYSLDNSFSSGKFTTVKEAILKSSEMWWGQHHRVKDIKTLHDFYYLIFSKYDDSPNYVVVLAETRSRLERKDLTTMEGSVTRDPVKDHCGSNDENLITRLQPIIWLHWREPIDYIKSHCDQFINGKVLLVYLPKKH